MQTEAEEDFRERRRGSTFQEGRGQRENAHHKPSRLVDSVSGGITESMLLVALRLHSVRLVSIQIKQKNAWWVMESHRQNDNVTVIGADRGNMQIHADDRGR